VHYADLAVRDLYPRSGSKFAPRPEPAGGYDPPPAPTGALPGTAEKLEELAARADAGVCLHHSGDARRGL
jgi:hypothetical protein